MRQHHSDGDTFAVHQTLGLVGDGRFQRVAKRMTQIEQRPASGLQFVRSHHIRLCLTGPGDGFVPLCPTGKHRLPVGFQPVEEVGIAQKTVFGNFRITGTKIAQRQRIQNGRIGQHQRGLMKGADEVLAMT